VEETRAEKKARLRKRQRELYGHGERREYFRRYYAENRERILANSKRWHDDHPDAAKAYGILRRAITNGEVEIPDCCTGCGEEAPLESHHEDYSKPLEVEWLCLSCHKVLHRERTSVP
jgi:hypothetical protein